MNQQIPLASGQVAQLGPAETIAGATVTPITVFSTSDERVVNNTMRQKYRVLSDDEKEIMDRVKVLGEEFLNLLHAAGGTDAGGERFGDRYLALAGTNMEVAVMWAVKSITK